MKTSTHRRIGTWLCGIAVVCALTLAFSGPWKERLVEHAVPSASGVVKKLITDEGPCCPLWMRLLLLVGLFGAHSLGIVMSMRQAPGKTSIRRWIGVGLCVVTIVSALAIAFYGPWEERYVMDMVPTGLGYVTGYFYRAPCWPLWLRIGLLVGLLGTQGLGVA